MANRTQPEFSVRSIAYIDHTAELGGAETALLRLLDALDRSRFKPTVILFSEGPLVDRLRQSDVEVLVIALGGNLVDASRNRLEKTLLRPGTIIAMAGHLWRVARFLRSRRFHLVHTTSLKADILGGIAARLAGCPLVWHIHDRIAEDYLPRIVARVFRIMARWLPRFVIVNSAATKLTLQPFDESRIRVVHPGIPEEDLDDASGDSITPQDAPIVGIVGRISPTKGQDVFLRAAALVVARFPNARFQIIGAPLFNHEAYGAEVRRLAAELKLGNLEFTGFCDDVKAKILNLTVLVHASPTPEPFGQVVIEAMAAGRPVVATNAGGIPEIVIDGDCGFLVPMRDQEAMAERICTILGDRARGNEMGRRGHDRVREHFTAGQMARKIEDVYEFVLEDGRNHKCGSQAHLGMTDLTPS